MNSELKSKKIVLQDANLVYYPNFIRKENADNLYDVLLNHLAWEQHSIKIFGKTIPQPRLTALYSINSQPYTYSGLTLNPHPFTKELDTLHSKIFEQTGYSFTHCLANLYRDGNDSMGWHTDNEKKLGNDPIIASLSLGGVRNFQLKHNNNKELKYSLPLDHGCLLIMKGKTQEFWKHQLPKTKMPVSPRINLTFRTIF